MQEAEQTAVHYRGSMVGSSVLGRFRGEIVHYKGRRVLFETSPCCRSANSTNQSNSVICTELTAAN